MATYVAQFPVLSQCLSNIQGSTMSPAYVYILASQRNGTLYVGSTSNIIKRTWEHKNNVIPGSTARITYICWSIMKHMNYTLKQHDVKNVSKIGQDNGK
jgi:predicted GIY-YIG superfamily endonuclease